jgi:hypothetical protein
MFIFFAIYAILAVELFRGFGAGGYYETYDDVSDDTLVISSLTKRGYIYGMEYYGTFSRAMYTLFQVQSGESWSEAVARPLIFGLTSTGGGENPIVLTYFYSFRILMKVVMLNVVVAVLLDSFGEGDGEDEDDMVDDVDDVIDEPTAPSAAAMTTAPPPAPPAPPATAPVASTVISAEAMTKLEKLLGKVDELGSLAKIFSEMQASVGLMKREVALMKTKPLIPRPEPQMLTPNPKASLDPPEDIQIRQDPGEAPSANAGDGSVHGSVQCSHRSSSSSQDDASSAAPSPWLPHLASPSGVSPLSARLSARLSERSARASTLS